jgi:hypothetical protein
MGHISFENQYLKKNQPPMELLRWLIYASSQKMVMPPFKINILKNSTTNGTTQMANIQASRNS